MARLNYMKRISKTKKMILIGVWANRNWILGNWIKEVKLRNPNHFRLWWIPSIYANKHSIEKFLKFPIPTAGAYFFSYPTIFQHYEGKNVNKFKNNSIVLYPHNEPEMGTIQNQVTLLNKAFKVYFYCKADAENLVQNGLLADKVVVANCAIDLDCELDNKVKRDDKTIILASKFGPRKGAHLLPRIVKELPNWNFIVMGRGWEDFILNKGLNNYSNFKYVEFNKENRAKYFSRARIFLSLSNLEGGPVPLIESMSLGVTPICTETGFAPEFITDQVNGFLLPIDTDVDLVISKINSIDTIVRNPSDAVKHLTWDRITKMTYSDLKKITELNLDS
jgi:glycosyltransferase involved in cell wall biosynthesis